MKPKRLLIILLWLLPVVGALTAQSAGQIISEMDYRQTFATLQATGAMISRDQFGEKRSDYISYSREGGDFRIEFINSEQEGEIVLRTGNQLYLYYPDAENVRRISGSMLKNSLFGNVSYEDLTEGNNTIDNYNAVLLGEEAIDGHNCWKIELTARVVGSVAYHRQIVWIDRQEYYPRKAEYYSRSGRLLKEFSVLAIEHYDDKIFISHMLLIDRLRGDSETEVVMDEIVINPRLSNRLFSRNSLR